MNILKKVRSTTRPWHDRMEEVALSSKIGDGTLSLHEYKSIILGHYVFHQSAEEMLLQSGTLHNVESLSVDERMKSQSLANDIDQLGIRPYTFAYRPRISVDTVPQALGVMYVMEGATLGGTVIGKALQDNPDIANSGAMDYYGCYGSLTGSRWKQFKEIVVREICTENDQSIFIEAAESTFKEYAACMEQAIHILQTEADNA